MLDFSNKNPAPKAFSYDFEDVARMLLGRSIDVCKMLLPGGRMQGHEYVVGDLSGRSGKSLSINTRTGVWTDFAGDAGGSDLIALWAAVQGVGQGEAKADAEGWLGIERAAPSTAGQAVAAQPEGVEVGNSWWRNVKATKIWEYQNGDGSYFGEVYRFDHPTAIKNGKPLKTIRQWNGIDWKSPEGIRPLYRLPELMAHVGPIIIVEGEKTADAVIDQDYCATTCWGGAVAAKYTDWSPMAGRDVVLWPDADPPTKTGVPRASEQWLTLLHGLLTEAGVASARVVE